MDNIVYSSVKHTSGFYETLMHFLNTKTGTLMTAAMGVSIGMAYKDAVVAIVDSLVKPLIVYIILATKLDKLYDFTYFFKTQDNALNLAILLKNVISFFIILAVVYYLHKLTEKVTNDDMSDSSSVSDV